jgi:hypothetical protein
MTGLWDNAVVHDVSGRDAPHRGAPEAPGSVRFRGRTVFRSYRQNRSGGLRKIFRPSP